MSGILAQGNINSESNSIVYTIPPDTLFTGKVMVSSENFVTSVDYYIYVNEILLVSHTSIRNSARTFNMVYSRSSNSFNGTSVYHNIGGTLEIVLGPNQDIIIFSNIPVNYLVTGYLSK